MAASQDHITTSTPMGATLAYQFHVGVCSARGADGEDNRPGRVAKFLDAFDRLEYPAALGVNAVQPLPLVEFRTPWSLGYNGTRHLLPGDGLLRRAQELPAYLDRVNALLANKGVAALTPVQLRGQVNQLKASVVRIVSSRVVLSARRACVPANFWSRDAHRSQARATASRDAAVSPAGGTEARCRRGRSDPRRAGCTALG
jgi:hypothetical protein